MPKGKPDKPTSWRMPGDGVTERRKDYSTKGRGAGRPPGSATIKTREIAEKIAATGMTPLEVICAIMRGEKSPDGTDWTQEQFQAAVAAAPYMHPRLTAVEAKQTVTLKDTPAVDRPPRETRDEWIARRQRELLAVEPAAGTAD